MWIHLGWDKFTGSSELSTYEGGQVSEIRFFLCVDMLIWFASSQKVQRLACMRFRQVHKCSDFWIVGVYEHHIGWA